MKTESIVGVEEMLERRYHPVSLGLGWSCEPKGLYDLVGEVLEIHIFLSAPGHHGSVMECVEHIRLRFYDIFRHVPMLSGLLEVVHLDVVEL